MRQGRWILLLIAALLIVMTASRVLPGPAGFSTRLTLNRRPSFLAGVNYPYKSAEDFGATAWGYAGVAQPTTRAEVETDFTNLARSGVRVVKWRVFNDGRASPRFDSGGYPTGLGDHFLADLDAALAIARRHGIYLVLTLFDSGFWTRDCTQQGVHLGGHADTLTDPAKRQALIDRVIVPLLRHLGANDRVLAFEIIAEPEWGIHELNHDQDNRLKVKLGDVRALVRQVTAAIHYYTPALATVESNRGSNVAFWRGLGLDYYSFSWYDWMEPWEPLDRPASSFGLDRPIVLGEFPGVGSRYYSLARIYDVALRQGYAGAFAWSYGNGDQYSDWDQVANDFLGWINGHRGVTFDGHVSLPVGPVQLLPPPYQLSSVSLQGAADGLWLQAAVRVAQPGTYHLQWFLYDATAGPGGANDEQTLSFTGKPLLLTVPLGTLADGRTYKVSLGIFDQRYHLEKWFEGVAVLQVKGGVAQLQSRVVEDPCGRQTPPVTTPGNEPAQPPAGTRALGKTGGTAPRSAIAPEAEWRVGAGSSRWEWA